MAQTRPSKAPKLITGTDLSLGQASVDGALTGETRLSVQGSEQAGVFTIDEAHILNEQAEITAQGVVGGAETNVIGHVNFKQLAALGAGLQGSLVADGRAVAALGPYVLIVAARGESADVVSRVFTHHFDIPEDPVTGSAHAVMVPYQVFRTADTLNKATKVIHQLREQHRASCRQGSPSPPQVQRGGMTVPNRLLTGRLSVDHLERKCHLDQLALLNHIDPSAQLSGMTTRRRGATAC